MTAALPVPPPTECVLAEDGDREVARWVDNVLVCRDGTLMTVLPGGIVEVRGPGWGRRRTSRQKRAQGPHADQCRVLRLWNEEKARRICALVAQYCAGP